MLFRQGIPVDRKGQGLADGIDGKQAAVHIAADVDEGTAFALPQLIVAAVVGMGIGAGVGADQAQPFKFKGIPDLGGGLGLQQADGLHIHSQIRAAPPVSPAAKLHPAQGGFQIEGAGTHRTVLLQLVGLENGDIQQQGQIFHGIAQPDHHRIGAHGSNGLHMVEPAAVIGAFHGGVQGSRHIIGGQQAAVGEGGVFQVNGVSLHVLGHAVALAEHGLRVIVAVHGEQALEHQGKQGPVRQVVAQERIHGALRVPGQLHRHVLVQRVFLRLGHHRTVVHHQGVARRDISLLFPQTAAGEKARQQHRCQHNRYNSLHAFPPPQTITAPWEPRRLPTFRWDQNSSGSQAVQWLLMSMCRTPARTSSWALMPFRFT